MELDETAKKHARELGDAVNEAIGSSSEVADAIEALRADGYEPHLSLKLEIALAKAEDEQDFDLGLTADDLRTLERMKIKIDE